MGDVDTTRRGDGDGDGEIGTAADTALTGDVNGEYLTGSTPSRVGELLPRGDDTRPARAGDDGEVPELRK